MRIDLVSASRSEVWELLEALSERLSSGIRLHLTGAVDEPLLATFTGRM